MAKLEIVRTADVAVARGYAGSHAAEGVVESRRIQPAGYSLWACVSELADGGSVAWGARHPDEAVYVLEGAVEIEGRVCPADGAVVVEADVATRLVARGVTRIVHFGPAEAAEARGDVTERGVHVVGPGGWFESGERAGTFARWYADSTCPTCRLCLIQVQRDGARDGPLHHHSSDEIIYVIGGSVALGSRWFEPGTALCIPAGVRYAIRTGEAGYRFLNYRRDITEQVYATDQPPLLESALARGGREVRDFR